MALATPPFDISTSRLLDHYDATADDLGLAFGALRSAQRREPNLPSGQAFAGLFRIAGYVQARRHEILAQVGI